MAGSKWRTNVLEGHKTMVLQVGNVTVTVHRPVDLSAEELRRREEQVRAVLPELGVMEAKIVSA